MITLLIAIFGYKYLKGSNLLQQSNIYYIRFQDVGQMEASAPVLTRGFKVGSVTKIMLDPESVDWVLVTIEVNKDIMLPKNVKAVLASQGLMGGKSILLQFDSVCKEDCLPEKSYIPGEIAGVLASMFSKDEVNEHTQSFGKELNTLLDTSKANENIQLASTIKNTHIILENLAQSSLRLNALLANSSKDISTTMANLEILSSSLARNSEALGNSIKHLDQISTSIAKADPGKLIQDADQTMIESKKTLQELSSTMKESRVAVDRLNGILSRINSGKGSLGQLINDPSLYKNLNSSSRNLNLLLQDLRLNPKRYIHVSVFGGNNQRYEAPESDPAEIK